MEPMMFYLWFGLTLLDAIEPSTTDEKAGNGDGQNGDGREKRRRRAEGCGDFTHSFIFRI